MCHIVDKIVLHFCQFLLTENDIQRENKRYQQHESKYHRRNHKAHRVENIIFFSGEVYFYDTHLGRRIVLKKRLGIRILASFHFKIRTTVYFSSIFIDYCEVIRQFYTIIKKGRLQVIIQILKPYAFAYRLVTGTINHLQCYFVKQNPLIHITILNRIEQ